MPTRASAGNEEKLDMNVNYGLRPRIISSCLFLYEPLTTALSPRNHSGDPAVGLDSLLIQAFIRPVCRKLEILPLVGPASRLGYPIFMEIRSSALIAQTAQISYLRAIHTGNTTRASKLMGVMICHQLMALRQKLTIAFAIWTEQDHPPRVG